MIGGNATALSELRSTAAATAEFCQRLLEQVAGVKRPLLSTGDDKG